MTAWFLLHPVVKFISHPAQRGQACYAWYYEHMPICKKMILYESFRGRGMLCGPYALFQELIRHPQYGNYAHVWVLDSLAEHEACIQRYKKRYPNVSFVQFGSRKYLKCLASAKYLINNVTFYSYFIKKPGQIYINTWHGIPLKHLGYDEPGGAVTASNMARNFLHADYLIAANPFFTDIYLKAYRQYGLSQAKIIEEGYPRLDTLIHAGKQKEDVCQKLREAGVEVSGDKKIILYAPTWRGTNTADPDCSVEGFVGLKAALEQSVDASVYQILVKVHQAVYHKIKDRLSEFSYVIPATIDANEVLGITDILISDYSSIYFDYLATGRPVLFYITDAEEYAKGRGLYFPISTLPGPHTDSLAKLGEWICCIDEVFGKYKERYDKVRDWCCSYDIGSISKKIVQAVFDGQTEGMRIKDCQSTKKKVLLSRGTMRVNGISTSLANLLNEFDYDAYDVTVLVNPPQDDMQKELILHLNQKARVLVRPGEMVKSVTEEIGNLFYTQTNPIRGFTKMIFPKQAYKREYRRLFGESTFDYVIDYEGYSNFFATLCLMQENARSYIWMHNDMRSEYDTKFHWLQKIFVLYPKFDYLVSCSRQIMEVNKQYFYHDVPKEKFRFAKNCIDFKRVHAGSMDGIIAHKDGLYYYAVPQQQGPSASLKLYPMQSGYFAMTGNSMEPYGSMEIFHRMESCNRIEFFSSRKKVENGVVRFINVARLSVEKNQAELIRAFARLAGEYKDVMLYLVGEGPERKNIEKLILQLHLSNKVILTGNMRNPFGLMRQCSCFILPSKHEGQPLVVFEARALHLPLILSDYASVGGSVIEDGQYMVHQDADSIYEGLAAFMNGKVPANYQFQDEIYNREAYAEFKNAVFGR